MADCCSTCCARRLARDAICAATNGLRAIRGGQVVSTVELREDLAGLHGLIVGDQNAGHEAADVGRNRGDVAADIGVIGALQEAAVVPPLMTIPGRAAEERGRAMQGPASFSQPIARPRIGRSSVSRSQDCGAHAAPASECAAIRPGMAAARACHSPPAPVRCGNCPASSAGRLTRSTSDGLGQRAGSAVHGTTRRLRARNACCPMRAWPRARDGNRGRARSAHIPRGAGARCRGDVRSRPDSTRPFRRRVSMLGAMPRLFWNWSKRVRPWKASRRIRMLHHSPTRSRLRAMGHCISSKLFRRMTWSPGHYQHATHISGSLAGCKSPCVD